MKRLNFITMLSIFLLCFGLVGCEKNEVIIPEQTISANGEQDTPIETEAIVEVDDIDP